MIRYATLVDRQNAETAWSWAINLVSTYLGAGLGNSPDDYMESIWKARNKYSLILLVFLMHYFEL